MPKRDNIEKMFNDIAGDYDQLNHIMSMNVDKTWRSRAIRKIITPDAPQKIMDLACGTGDFSIAIAKKMNPGSHVYGVDLSEGMLDVMRRKVAAGGLEDKISIQKGIGEKLEFEDGTFDLVTIAFGIRNFEDRQGSLREILRVLKPGGKIAILELSVPANPVIRWFYNLYFSKLMPLVGRWISGNGPAYKYLPASVNNFPGKKQWMQTMQDCGFTKVTHKAFTLGLCRFYIGEKA